MNSQQAAKKELFSRAIDTVLPSQESLELAMDKAESEGRQLRAYLGIDPTSPHLHIGHTVAMGNLALWQKAGHKVMESLHSEL